MKNATGIPKDPWIKLILVSLGGLLISWVLLWTLQQMNGFMGPGVMNGNQRKQEMNMQMNNSGGQMMGNMH